MHLMAAHLAYIRVKVNSEALRNKKVADDILCYYYIHLFFFSEKMGFEISCESSARHDSHKMASHNFSVNYNRKLKLSSAAVFC